MESEWGGDRRRVIGVCFRDRRRAAARGVRRGGVLGPAPGVMGTFQAIEAIKTLSGVGESMRGKLMMFDALSARPTRTLEVRDEPDPACERCGAGANFGDVAAYDYDAFLSSTPCSSRAAAAARLREGGVDLTAPPAHGSGDALDDDVSRASAWSRVSARDFATTLDSGRALVVDVRPAHAFAAARLPDSVSAPIDRLDERAWRDIDARSREKRRDDIVHFICAGGVNSQRAAEWFSTLPDVVRRGRRARDVRGGFASWRATSIRRFPNSTSDCYDSPRNHSVRTLPTASRYNITLHEHYAIVETTIPLYRTSR